MNLADNRLKQVMKKQKMTQEELEEITGINQSDISKIIAGKKERLTLVNAAKISMALGHSIEYLWPGLFK